MILGWHSLATASASIRNLRQILGFRQTPRANHFQSHEAAQTLLVRFVDDSHPTMTELGQNLVTVDLRKFRLREGSVPIGRRLHSRQNG